MGYLYLSKLVFQVLCKLKHCVEEWLAEQGHIDRIYVHKGTYVHNPAFVIDSGMSLPGDKDEQELRL